MQKPDVGNPHNHRQSDREKDTEEKMTIYTHCGPLCKKTYVGK